MRKAIAARTGFKAISLSVAVTIGAVGIFLPIQKVYAKSQAVEVLKYFNPVPEKKHYLNEGQDRLIKTRKFKAVALEGAQPVFNKEIGLFAVIPTEKIADTKAISEILSKPNISGLSVTIPWKVLEPKEDEFNWKPLDDLLAQLKPSGKTMIVRISTCGLDTVPSGYQAPAAEDAEKKTTAALDSDTPAWVFSGDVKTMEYTGKDGKQHLMPIFWNTNYLAKWSNFVTEMGEKYDKNPNIHSIGITGGGVAGGTTVVPDVTGEKGNYEKLEKLLTKDHGMSQRQLVEHWKYVADIFPKAFPTARLNFDVDPPTQNRAGQDTLDEISDYLIYRYGQRVYITRQNVNDGKHGFDQYRVVIKFHPDTFTGYQLTDKVDAQDLDKIAKNAPVDGISYVEVPMATLDAAAKDEALAKSLEELRSKLGYQLVSQKITFDEKLKQGDKLKASFEFLNLGAAPPMRPSREFDKDVAASYKVQMEFRDESGKPIGQSLHTPQPPTNQWLAGKPITWTEELKMPALKPGKYTVFVSVVDVDTKRKLQILNASAQGKPTAEFAIAAGDLRVE